MNFYLLAGLVSIALTIVNFAPYVIDIRRGLTKPHLFSWVIWSISTSVVFFAQLAADGGAGAWPTGMSAALTIYVTSLAWRRSADLNITRMDWIFLWSALGSLPVWYFTADPLWSVIILTTVDVLGFGPTLRKSCQRPFEESPLFYFLFGLRSLLSIFALEALNLTTLLFPLAMVVSCTIVFLLLWWCRRRSELRGSL